ncbi:MAG: GGDEF domain-containing protein [Deltaproteobacteria bacterium]|nr:GGDEF domain-containing protein [Deltaproteobacteria bacterium]MCB9785694.1 GGDEF domain-containing protein [Deltaproteobacteria bacterium]
MSPHTHTEPNAMKSTPEALRIIAELEAQVARLQEQVEELGAYRELAHRDALTGLRNRRYFDERLAEEISRAGRSGQYDFSVLLIDVNGLKVINDTDGHQAGDRAIREVAAFLEASFRQYDICCRIGGDEFAVLLPGMANHELPRVLARLHRAMVHAQRQGVLTVGIAVGAATWGRATSDAASLIAAADAAMYAAKLRMKEGGDFTTAVEAIAPAAEATRPSVLIPVLAARMFAPPAPGLRTHRDARRAFTRARWRPLPGHDPPPPPQRAPGWSDHASGGRFSDRRGPRTRGGFAEGIIGSLPLTRLS